MMCNYVDDTHFESAYVDSRDAHQTQETPCVSNLAASAEAKAAWFNQIKYQERRLLGCTTYIISAQRRIQDSPEGGANLKVESVKLIF